MQNQPTDGDQAPEWSDKHVFLFDFSSLFQISVQDPGQSLQPEDVLLGFGSGLNAGLQRVWVGGKTILSLMKALQDQGCLMGFYYDQITEEATKQWTQACGVLVDADPNVQLPKVDFLIQNKGDMYVRAPSETTFEMVQLNQQATPFVSFKAAPGEGQIRHIELKKAAEHYHFKLENAYVFHSEEVVSHSRTEEETYHTYAVHDGNVLACLQQAAQDFREKIEAQPSLAQEDRPTEPPSQPEQSPPKRSFWRTVAYVVMAVLSLGVLPAIAAYRRYVGSSKDSQAEGSDNTTGAVPEPGLAEQNHLSPRKDSYFSVYRGLCDSVLPGSSSQDERKNTHGVSNR